MIGPACTGMTSLFYSDDDSDQLRAKKICQECSIRSTCLERSIERREDDGVWGGMTNQERRRIIRQRRLV